MAENAGNETAPEFTEFPIDDSSYWGSAHADDSMNLHGATGLYSWTFAKFFQGRDLLPVSWHTEEILLYPDKLQDKVQEDYKALLDLNQPYVGFASFGFLVSLALFVCGPLTCYLCYFCCFHSCGELYVL